MRIRRIYYFFSLALVLIPIFISCIEEVEEAVILTEDVLYLSGERVRLSGRIYSNGGKEISDHGFEIGLSENYDNPIIIQNGERSSLGAFIGESSQLIADKEYYYRAFAVINDVIYYGKSKSFITHNASLSSFSPHFAYFNDKLKIIGANFSTNIKVFFGKNEAEILSIDLESIIEVRVPEIGSSTQVFIKVTNGTDEILFSEPFEYVFGVWNQISEFPQDFGFYEGISLAKSDHYVFGLGVRHNAKTFNNTIWDFDLKSNIWAQVPYTGTIVRGPFSNSGGYFGAGAEVWGFEPKPILGNEFWQYENGTLSYIGELPFGLYKAASFYYNGEVFVTGGLNISGETNFNAYMYSEVSNTWSTLPDAPIEIAQDLPNFTYSNFQYFVTKEEEIWSFNLDTKIWKIIGDVPIFVIEGGICQVIDDKAYIGIYKNSRIIWEYDIINNSWKEKSRLESSATFKNAGSYVNQKTIRLIRVNPLGLDEDKMPIFEFDPMAF